MTLEEFATKYKLSPTDLADALRADGFVVDNSKATIEQIAQTKSASPRDVYQTLSRRFPNAGLPGGGMGGGGGGMGRRGGGGGGVNH